MANLDLKPIKLCLITCLAFEVLGHGLVQGKDLLLSWVLNRAPWRLFC